MFFSRRIHTKCNYLQLNVVYIDDLTCWFGWPYRNSPHSHVLNCYMVSLPVIIISGISEKVPWTSIYFNHLTESITNCASPCRIMVIFVRHNVFLRVLDLKSKKQYWVRAMVLNAPFNTISTISWRSVLLVKENTVSCAYRNQIYTDKKTV